MKAMCPPGYHHNGHMATHALEHMMYGSGYIYIYMYVYISMYVICIYIYICIHESNVPSWLSPYWPYGNPCTWAHDIRLYVMCPSA